MKLAEKLEKIQRDFEAGETPQAVIDVLNANIDKLLSEKVADRALQVGDLAPLEIAVEHGKTVLPLQTHLKSDYLILNWFRGSW